MEEYSIFVILGVHDLGAPAMVMPRGCVCVSSQLLQEQEKEERKLREAREKALQDLSTQLRDQQVSALTRTTQ